MHVHVRRSDEHACWRLRTQWHRRPTASLSAIAPERLPEAACAVADPRRHSGLCQPLRWLDPCQQAVPSREASWGWLGGASTTTTLALRCRQRVRERSTPFAFHSAFVTVAQWIELRAANQHRSTAAPFFNPRAGAHFLCQHPSTVPVSLIYVDPAGSKGSKISSRLGDDCHALLLRHFFNEHTASIPTADRQSNSVASNERGIYSALEGRQSCRVNRTQRDHFEESCMAYYTRHPNSLISLATSEDEEAILDFARIHPDVRADQFSGLFGENLFPECS